MWEICGIKLVPGEKKQVILEPDVPGYEMPATLLCGAKPGMTVLVTAGIHSGEYPGVPAVIRTAAELDPARLTGNLIMIHCVNTSGFWAKSPALIPEDGFNLNGNYPGKAGGTTGERIANFFVEKVFPNVDFIVDMHSGGSAEPLTRCLFFPKAEKVREVSLAAAKALDIPYLIESTAVKGEYSYAANYFDVPGLLVETGYCYFCREEWVEAYHSDLYRLFAHFGMYRHERAETPVCEKKVYRKTVYLEADRKGIWYPAVRENQKVKKGQLLGHLEDFFGNTTAEYFAEDDGTVFYYTCGLAICPGDPLVAYGLEASVETE